jgi:hypothetical protein
MLQHSRPTAETRRARSSAEKADDQKERVLLGFSSSGLDEPEAPSPLLSALLRALRDSAVG